MPSARHFKQTVDDGLHAPFSWIYANVTDRDNHVPATGPTEALTVDDNLKLCYVSGTGNAYILTDYSVPTWQPFNVATVTGIDSGIGEIAVASGDAIGDLMYMSGSAAMAKADNGSLSTAPAVAIITGKPSSTTATVRYAGKVSGFSGFTPGEDLFLGTAGSIIGSGSLPSSANSIIQRIGTALSATELLLDVGPIVIL